MTLSFLRPAIFIALAAASLAGCGGSATFQITGVVAGLHYPGLILTDTFSGQSITVAPTATTFAFPNTIDYGTQYNVIVSTAPAGQPLHQSCTPNALATGTAGQRTAITMGVSCIDTPHSVFGSITVTGTGGSYVGLKLINGSNDLNPFSVTDAATTAYAYPGITFGTPYGITIFQQPTDLVTKCTLVPKPVTSGTQPKAVDYMGDADIEIDVVCVKP